MLLFLICTRGASNGFIDFVKECRQIPALSIRIADSLYVDYNITICKYVPYYFPRLSYNLGIIDKYQQL
jgi:hypothetical protein